MFLLAGLGNPGAKYARNRHNVGFMAIAAIAEAHRAGPMREKFQGLIAEATIGEARALLLLPQTYYNESGNAIAAAARFHKIEPANIIVFHDEIDLDAGKLKMKCGGGNAGNNGLRSTAAHLGPDFWRVRIGVGHPGDKAQVTAHVLGDFGRTEEAEWLAPMLAAIGRHAPMLLPPADTSVSRFLTAMSGGGARPTTARAEPAPDRAPKPPKPAAAPAAPTSPFAALAPLKDSPAATSPLSGPPDGDEG